MISDLINLNRVISVLEETPFRTDTSCMFRVLSENLVDQNEFLQSLVTVLKNKANRNAKLTELRLELEQMYDYCLEVGSPMEFDITDVQEELLFWYRHMLHVLNKFDRSQHQYLIGVGLYNEHTLIMEFFNAK